MAPAERNRVVILGGGVGGTLVANRIAKKLGTRRVDITLIDRTGQHVYQPGFIYVAFGDEDGGALVREEGKLLKRGIRLLTGEATRIDPKGHRVFMEDGRELVYDFLVMATGSHLDPGQIPGAVGNAHHFYSLEGARKLRQALQEFGGGKVVVAIGGVPYKCPPAPAEAACQLDYLFHRRGMRNKVEIHLLSPLPRVFPLESLNPLVEEVLRSKGVKTTTMFNVEAVDGQAKVVNSLEGESVPYDILILVPPHRGAPIAAASGLADRGGWIPTDKHSLKVKGVEDIWAIGDATDIPISKAGATAHFEGLVVADNIIRQIRGHGQDRTYGGRVTCMWDAGFHRGLSITFDYDHPPEPRPLARRHYWMKAAINRFYWHLIPTARV